jgi:hypothetical protein
MCCSYYLFKKLYMGRIIMQVSLIMLRVKLANWEWCDGRHLFECIFDMAPGKLQEGSRKAPRRPQEGSMKAPGRLHEGSRKAPDRLQESSRKASGRFQEGSGRRQESSRYYTSHTPKRIGHKSSKKPKKSQKEGQEDKDTLLQQGESSLALLRVPGCPALPSGYFLGSLELPQTMLKVAKN